MYPPQAVQALREALKSVYYYKHDLRQFFLASDLPAGIVSKQAWDDSREYKVHIVRKVLDELLALGNEGIGPMRRLIQGVLSFPNFDHLRKLDDGPRLVQEARHAVEGLRHVVEQHDATLLESKKERAEASVRVASVNNRRHEETRALYDRFCELVTLPDEARASARALSARPLLCSRPEPTKPLPPEGRTDRWSLRTGRDLLDR